MLWLEIIKANWFVVLLNISLILVAILSKKMAKNSCDNVCLNSAFGDLLSIFYRRTAFVILYKLFWFFSGFPENQNRGGVEDTGVSTGNNANEKGDHKPADSFAAE